ncbi:MAG TPA: DUF192 domain-containing protein [Quisquiliibacterium sp.]|nr:DUF192 domain-containing protein [Quisquiliibacterium sp.]
MNRTMEGLVVAPRGAAFALLGVEGRPVNLGVEVAASIRQRLRGWLGRVQAPRERGLWIVPCDAVHTMAMKFPIDLVFVNGGGRILRIDAAVPPWRVRVCLGAHSVIELEAGQAARLGLVVGDCLERRRV